MTDPFDISTGQRLRRQREDAGLTREALAFKAGVSFKTLERIEADRSNPRPATLKVLEQALAESIK